MRILHQYPDMMPKLRCDQGAIKFVLSGANIMCPGLTSPGATMHDEVGSPAGRASAGVGRLVFGLNGSWQRERHLAVCLTPLNAV
jgi:predicted RNA-binding protein (TIGR00451 family)